MIATVTITMNVRAASYDALAWWLDNVRENIKQAAKVSNAEVLVETSLHIESKETS